MNSTTSNAPAPRPRKGPWSHRFLVFVFSAALTLLVYWLLGFALRDIGAFPGPDWNEIERRHLDPAQVARHEQLQAELETAKRQIKDQGTRQSVLSASISNAQTTIGEMSSLHKLALEKGTPISEAEKLALADAEILFLDSQKRHQSLTEEIATLKETEVRLENDKHSVDKDLEAQRARAREEYQALRAKHNLRVASLKLLFLLPVTLAIAWAFMKRRNSLYKPLVYSTGIAVYWKLGQVMHEYFPSKLFKYILIFVALGIVLKALVYLLRQIVAPQREWLLKQYREAYEKFLCPICGYPIRRGPLKYLFWTSRSIKKMIVPRTAERFDDEPYVCPCCATALFEPCDACEAVRPSLLPACDHCGVNHEEPTTTVKPSSPGK